MNTSIQELNATEIQEVSGGFFSLSACFSLSLSLCYQPKTYSCDSTRDYDSRCGEKTYSSCEPKPSCGGSTTPTDPTPLPIEY